MKANEIRFLYAYDRWATRRVLAALDGINSDLWAGTGLVGERGLGQILVHQLGAAQRWRVAFETQGDGEGPRPEDEPLPTIEQLRERWDAEWHAVDDWLASLSEAFIDAQFDGVPVWQMLVHVVNHGTQHRSEVAALLTADGRSPGDLDLVDYADEQSAVASAT